MKTNEIRLLCAGGVVLVPVGMGAHVVSGLAVTEILTVLGFALALGSACGLFRESPCAAAMTSGWVLWVAGLLAFGLWPHRCPPGAFAGIEHLPALLAWLGGILLALVMTPVVLWAIVTGATNH